MNPSRFFRGLLGALLALSLLVLLAHTLEPARANASPPQAIPKGGGPGDPGTPFEEPENDPTGSSDPTPPVAIVGSPGAPIATPDPAPTVPRRMDRRWLTFSVQSWRLQLQILLRF